MQAVQTNINAARAEGLEVMGAPSLTAAVRADAELLVKLCIENKLQGSVGAMSKYLRGDVSVNVTCFDAVWFANFYRTGAKYAFAVVKVEV